MATKMTAEDLRYLLAIGTQPALLTESGHVAEPYIDSLVEALTEAGVTLRRLDNALAVVSVPEPARGQIRKALGATD